jgi:hypothetical protein
VRSGTVRHVALLGGLRDRPSYRSEVPAKARHRELSREAAFTWYGLAGDDSRPYLEGGDFN